MRVPTWEVGNSGLPHRDLSLSRARAFRVRHGDDTEIGAFGHYGVQGGEFDRNREAASDFSGNVYVSDYNRVQRFKMIPESR